MIGIRPLTSFEKILILAIALLAGALLAGWQPGQAAHNQLTQYTDKQLYDRAQRFSSEGNIVTASAYLYAYIQRNPSSYARNVGGHRAAVDAVFQNWMSKALDYQTIARTAGMHIASCEQYPCRDNESEIRTMFSRGFPEDMIQVCVHSDYKGQCSYLALGEYTSWRSLGVPNDSISSVRVGANVQALLCVHSLNHGDDCMAFWENDSNLNNNRVPGKNYMLNDNISTIRVSYRPGKGLTLP